MYDHKLVPRVSIRGSFPLLLWTREVLELGCTSLKQFCVIWVGGGWEGCGDGKMVNQIFVLHLYPSIFDKIIHKTLTKMSQLKQLPSQGL